MTSNHHFLTVAGATFGLLLAASPVLAHHSPAMYDQNHPITVEATVKSMQWVNPHSNIVVVTEPKAGEASKTLTVEMSSPGVLTRAGWTKRTFSPGDRIQLTYGPLRAGGASGIYMSAVNSAGKVLKWNFKPGETANLEQAQ